MRGTALLALAGCLLALSSCVALAQQAPTEITLKLPTQLMLVIAKGLQELPYKEAAPVLTEIQRQVNEQMRAGEEKK